MDNGIEQVILKYCHDKYHGKRVVGMRNLNAGYKAVMYIDTMGSTRLDDGTFNPRVVLFVGDSWKDVLAQIHSTGWHE